MEVIKKTIKQAVTTGITESCSGDCRVIIPDLNAVYYINVLLKSRKIDWGVFDEFIESENTEEGFIENGEGTPIIITGESKSRLSELKKYAINGDFFSQYQLSTGNINDGVDQNLSDITINPQKIVYYIGGITFVDLIYDNDITTTTFSFEGQGYNSPDFINVPIIKNPNKSKIISNPKIDNDVFIIRQELSVFDKNYKLKDVQSLVDLTTYAGGSFFNIIKNT